MTFKRPKSLKELALEYLREKIVTGQLEMGERLSERKISEELGVSKSPIREALARLQDEGLVIIEPQKGMHVFTLSKTEVAQICDFRLAIEYAAFELALERNAKNLIEDMGRIVKKMIEVKEKNDIKAYLQWDAEFHQLIFQYACNPYLHASYNQYVGKISALRTHLSQYEQHTDLSLDEHENILKAAMAKDLKSIRQLLQKHIARSEDTYNVISKD